ncbi:MAG TPA: hypothetical protein EYQ05_13905 [Gammaproteobacteria bacterium]|nr:hypothetical protein [Gammaproteobacteria bacterium]HIM03588.1 hypothetical protein [Gammaproteobacteria bacterium]
MALEENDDVTSDNCTSRAGIQTGTTRKILGTSSGAAFFGAVYLILVEGLSLGPSVSSFCEVREHINPPGIFPENHLRDLF